MNCSAFNPLRDIEEFQTKVLGATGLARPGLLDHKRMKHNIECLYEEVFELKEAYGRKDLVGVVDAIIDGMYFSYGFLYQMGIPVEEVWKAVHIANISKVRGKTHRGVDGDAQKPDGWKGPEETIRELLK